MKLLHGLFALSAGLGLAHPGSAQTALFTQNFSTLGGTLINNPSGTTSTQVSNLTGSIGTGTGSTNYWVGSQQTLSVVEKSVGGGDYALRLTDNNTVSNFSTISHNFTGVSTTGTGENIISGSFEYIPLALTSGTRGDLVFGIGTTGSNSTGAANTAVQLVFSGGLIVQYLNGGTLVTPATPNLTVGTTYRINVTADFGSATQDTWSLNIVNTTTETTSYSVSGLSTRAANITPGAIFMAGAGNAGRISTDPHIQIDNINFTASSAIPEPGTYAAWLGGAALLLVGWRRRNR